MRKLVLASLMVLALPLVSLGGPIYNLVPSAGTNNVNGIEFSPLGGDFVLTNTLTQGPGGPPASLYLDFGVAFDYTDSQGNVFFKPANDKYQLYVLTGKLAKTPPNPPPLSTGLFMGESEAFNLGNGHYDYVANLLGMSDFKTGVYDSTAYLNVTFNTNAELGHQVEGGTLNFINTSGGVPEPASVVMTGLGLCGVGLWSYMRRRAKRSCIL